MAVGIGGNVFGHAHTRMALYDLPFSWTSSDAA